ncbi:MAG: ABC transporter substrate-binding protein [Deltaproteobacteria bacterium]|jgi:branched-chain amino acid transport system substrate-binding protein|nr:ABC transporter substrate-binding protein [Deltaproteobacteria bacterium]MBT4642556.1 ABC transporter substrate-binding protein [Deltaproteobacteria bacterium]
MNIKKNLLFVMMLTITSFLIGVYTTPVFAKEKGPLIVGLLEDLSGPSAAHGQGTLNGWRDGVRYINEERDGVLGHPINIVWYDYKYDQGQVMKGYEYLKRKGMQFLMSGTGSYGQQAAQQKDHMPGLFYSGHSLEQYFPTLEKPSFLFYATPSWDNRIEILAKQIEKHWAKSGKSGKPKVGLNVLNVGHFPKMLNKITKVVCGKRGWECILNYSAPNPADSTTEILQFKNAGCDYIFIMSTESGIISPVKEMARQGYKPKIYGHMPMTSSEYFSALGNFAVGTVGYAYNISYTDDANAPGLKLLHRLNAKWHPELAERSTAYVGAFSASLAIAEAFKRAINKVGYTNLNGDALKDAMETMNKFQVGGLVPFYRWTPTDHQGVPGLKWYVWQKGGTLTADSDFVLSLSTPSEAQ